MANLFFINQEFSKSEDFDNVVTRYQNETQYILGKFDSRTMETYCRKSGKNVDDYPNLSHYYYYMRCSRGGSYVPKKKCGVHSRNVKSNKIDCPVQLRVSADLQRKVLVVTEWISDHNHEPENKKLDHVGGTSKLVQKGQKLLADKSIEKKSNDQLAVSKILEKIKSNIAFDENTARRKKEMLINLLESFEKMDENEQISSDDESTHSLVPPQTNKSPLHLDLPATPSPLPVNKEFSASMEPKEQNLEPSVLMEEISPQTSTCGRPKRQRKPALGSDFYTYGTARLKKRI
ncbi:uncharacterized protein LOC123258759 [Cotesia glomerata]|uniref:ZSWIM3 N-terminal domain-containing protein n=1 Tax=Cotesia glomerata TaxID=32391 RepID=A0AAV7I2B5_COTGL|nr:uncharacterized protein LOC123258759 [Cotesia glomerata]KAH0540119.1 hypothetical protein KQX54_013052 [Cotesia glomerata]